ncbi:MAG: hypothetical protein M1504_00535 [Candidatus Marsarchaeota archaeon]|nr:hypothetical protein [Candidatus Marsarchaeota archaeon]
MEYLMTYGWAILIIAVVLGVLFQLGVFNAATFEGNSCLAYSGYLCSQQTLNTAGTLSFTFGYQGANFTVDGFGCSSNSIEPSFSMAGISNLQPGQEESISVSCPVSSGSIGTPFSGYIWMEYDQAGHNGLVAKIASISTSVSVIGSSSSVPTITDTYLGNIIPGSSGQTTASITLTSGYSEYFCEAVLGWFYSSTSVSIDQLAETSGGAKYGIIGHQTSNTCTFTQTQSGADMVLAGIGVSSSTYSILSSGTLAASPNTIAYTVSTPSTFVIIMLISVYSGTSFSTLPSGCSIVVSKVDPPIYSDYILACPQQPTGPYSVGITNPSLTSSYPDGYVVYGVT